jgi:putative sterol carrier protein
MAFTNVQEIFENMVQEAPTKVGDLDAVILFDLGGEGGGKWTVTFGGGQASVEEGETAAPAMTLSMDTSDFIAMSNGELNAMNAFMQGKIKIAGDMGLAMKLQTILS